MPAQVGHKLNYNSSTFPFCESPLSVFHRLSTSVSTWPGSFFVWTFRYYYMQMVRFFWILLPRPCAWRRVTSVLHYSKPPWKRLALVHVTLVWMIYNLYLFIEGSARRILYCFCLFLFFFLSFFARRPSHCSFIKPTAYPATSVLSYVRLAYTFS